MALSLLTPPVRMQATSIISTARVLADTFSAMRRLGITDRGVFDSVLRETLSQNSQYLGVWTVWEPNALDGRDRDFANAPGHDGTGRFIPLWNRRGGIHVEPNIGYDVPGFGDWYLVPMRRRTETVIDPYEFPFAGRPEFITSQVAPIFHRGECVGAVGVDIVVDDFARPGSMPLEETLQRGFIFVNAEGAVEYWSERTRELLGAFTGERPGRHLPPCVAARLARFRRLGSGVKLPPLRRGHSVLRLNFARHPQRGGYLIIVGTAPESSPQGTLTAREREVLEWLAQAKSNTEIGIILNISTHTVKRHVERVLTKTGAENRCAAALAGVRGC